MIGEFDRRVTFKTWGSSQDPGGGPIAVLILTYTVWAKVEARSGTFVTSEQQAQWNYDYKITFRYEKSRVAKSNQTIDYDGKRLRINSISFEDEGNRRYAVARCTTIDASVDTSKDAVAQLDTFSYYGIDHESEFTADGTPMTLPTVAKDLRGKTIIGAFKDGIEFEVILAGIPDPLTKQVLYNPSTGNFTWSIPFEPNEYSLIQFF